jgi:acetyl-CoA carboxylase biotin carboxyl carrier protein
MAQREDITRLIATIDRLEELLQRSALTELELEVQGTTVIPRTPAAFAPAPAPVSMRPEITPDRELVAPAVADGAGDPGGHAVLAPLTGVFYRSPTPDAEPYVREGGPVNDGQVIGLIEAMKLFNEIKSDVTGVVRNIHAGDGDLVKARQALIEVEPS